MGCDYCNYTGRVVPFVGEAHACPRCWGVEITVPKSDITELSAALTAMFSPQVFSDEMLPMDLYHKDDPRLNVIGNGKIRLRHNKVANRFEGRSFDTTFSTKPDAIKHEDGTEFVKHKSGEYYLKGHILHILESDGIIKLRQAYNNYWVKENSDKVWGHKIGDKTVEIVAAVKHAHLDKKITDAECITLSHKPLYLQKQILNQVLKTDEAQFEASLEATEICYHQHRDDSIHKVLNCVYYAYAHKLIDDDEYESIGLRPLSQQAAVLTLMKPGVQTTTKFKEEFISGIKDIGIKDISIKDSGTPTISDIISLLRDAGNQTQDASLRRRLHTMKMKLAEIDASMMGTGIVDRVPLLNIEAGRISPQDMKRMNRG